MSPSPDDFRPVDADDALSDLDFDESELASDESSTANADAGSAEQLQAEVEQYKDRVLRATAEFENYRRRVQREMQDERKFASQPLLVDLLPVLDNIERAIDAAQQSSGANSLLEGFKMVQQQMTSILERHNCIPVPAAGQIFDPTLHQAILQTPSADVEPGRIVHVSQNGYQLNGRVIRPAQVIVSSGPTT